MDRRGPLLAALVVVSACGRIDYRALVDASVGLDADAIVDATVDAVVDGTAGDATVDADGGACARPRFEEPVLVAEVSSPSQEYGPTLSADLLTLYFHSDRPGGAGGYDLYVAERPSIDAPFGEPLEMTTITSADEDGGASLSSDGLTLYFHSHRSGPRRIYTATRASVGDPFGSVTPVEGALLGLSDQGNPDVSRDDLALYFASSDPAGDGEGDVWVSTRDDRTSAWGTPASVAGVNTADTEGTPSVDASQLALYLVSTRRESATDVFVATRAAPTDPFSTPTLLPIASMVGIGEHDADISDDGSTLVFALHRAEGVGNTDIWISTRVCDP
jgi:hypothetical protein